MTLAIPVELHNTIQRHKEIKWSEVARSAITEYAKKLELADKLASDSKLTDEEAFEIGEKIKKSVWEKHYKKYLKTKS